MKSGLDNKRNVVILSVLAVVMVGAVAYFAKSMFGGSNPAAAPAQETTAARTEPGAASQAGSRSEGGRAAEKTSAAGEAGSDAASGANGGRGVAGVQRDGAEYFLPCIGATEDRDR